MEIGARTRCLCSSEIQRALFPIFFLVIHCFPLSFIDDVPLYVSFFHTILHTMSPIINCCVAAWSEWKHTCWREEWKLEPIRGYSEITE